jgi:hypothetical protein
MADPQFAKAFDVLKQQIAKQGGSGSQATK